MKPNKTVHLHEYLPLLPKPRVRAEIDTDALADNYRALLARVTSVFPGTEGIAVVKADAYGHGIRPAVGALLSAGCRAFAVATPEEAVALRRLLRRAHADIPAPLILVLGYAAPETTAHLAAYDITVALLSNDHAAAMEACARRLGVTIRAHAALDTGMNRIGYPAHTQAEMAETVDALAARFGRFEQSTTTPGLRLDGLFTHFARADEDFDTEMRTPDSLTMTQYSRYRSVLNQLIARGLRPRLCHICNSAASVRFPESLQEFLWESQREALPGEPPGGLPNGCFDAVRLGINLYGYGVTPPSGKAITRPTMKLVTTVVHVHGLLPGESVGYGGTYVSESPRTLVTLPIGYADGWIRAFTGALVTLHTPVGDFPVPIVGRICMDQCMADITDLPADARASVAPGTPVTLFGSTAAELELLAERAHTISYELLCLITARVPRIYHP